MKSDFVQAVLNEFAGYYNSWHERSINPKFLFDPTVTFGISSNEGINSTVFWFTPKIVICFGPFMHIDAEPFFDLLGSDEAFDLDFRQNLESLCADVGPIEKAELLFWFMSMRFPSVTDIDEFDRLYQKGGYYQEYSLWRQIRPTISGLWKQNVISVTQKSDLSPFIDAFAPDPFLGSSTCTIIVSDECLIFRMNNKLNFTEFRIVIEDAWKE